MTVSLDTFVNDCQGRLLLLAAYVITNCDYRDNHASPQQPQYVITYPANSYCSKANSFGKYTTVRHLMMVV
jgi:hypothetical protein